MIKKILQIGDPVLEKKSLELDIKKLEEKKIQSLIDNLIETAYSEVEKSAGISAPQIGENLNIIVARRFDLQKNEDDKKVIWEVIINPRVLFLSEEESVFWEGCLSVGVGQKALFGPVKRKREVKIRYTNREGKEKEYHGRDFMSHIVQHEIDHLDGTLFLSHINNPDNIWTSKKLDEYMKVHNDYPPAL
ncbi:peptide deformylase [Candidatus Dojkabacteria bacterium]|nr:peptide deformylase [Candidatus Dojkabacteria bacterium]